MHIYVHIICTRMCIYLSIDRSIDLSIHLSFYLSIYACICSCAYIRMHQVSHRRTLCSTLQTAGTWMYQVKTFWPLLSYRAPSLWIIITPTNLGPTVYKQDLFRAFWSLRERRSYLRLCWGQRRCQAKCRKNTTRTRPCCMVSLTSLGLQTAQSRSYGYVPQAPTSCTVHLEPEAWRGPKVSTDGIPYYLPHPTRETGEPWKLGRRPGSHSLGCRGGTPQASMG